MTVTNPGSDHSPSSGRKKRVHSRDKSPNGNGLGPRRDTGHLRPQFPPSLSSPRTLRAPLRLAALTIFPAEITSAAAQPLALPPAAHRAPQPEKRLAETMANQRVAQRTLVQSERARAVPTELDGRPRRSPTVGLRGGRKVQPWSNAKGRSTGHAHSGWMLGKGACAEVHSWVWFGATLWAKLANACESREPGETRLVPTLRSQPSILALMGLFVFTKSESVNGNGRSGVSRRQEVETNRWNFPWVYLFPLSKRTYLV